MVDLRIVTDKDTGAYKSPKTLKILGGALSSSFSIPLTTTVTVEDASEGFESAVRISSDVCSNIPEAEQEAVDVISDKFLGAYTDWLSGSLLTLSGVPSLNGLLVLNQTDSLRITQEATDVENVNALALSSSVREGIYESVGLLNTYQMCIYHYLNNLSHLITKPTWGITDRLLSAKAYWNNYAYSLTAEEVRVSQNDTGFTVYMGYNNTSCSAVDEVVLKVRIDITKDQAVVVDYAYIESWVSEEVDSSTSTDDDSSCRWVPECATDTIKYFSSDLLDCFLYQETHNINTALYPTFSATNTVTRVPSAYEGSSTPQDDPDYYDGLIQYTDDGYCVDPSADIADGPIAYRSSEDFISSTATDYTLGSWSIVLVLENIPPYTSYTAQFAVCKKSSLTSSEVFLTDPVSSDDERLAFNVYSITSDSEGAETSELLGATTSAALIKTINSTY